MKHSKNKKLTNGTNYDIIILGGGIGGLLTAANLAGSGKKICLIERLGFLGGRFTSIPYNGFNISTGALHLLPHGRHGHMGKMLYRLIKQPIMSLKSSYFLKNNGYGTKLEKTIPSYFKTILKDRFKVVWATSKYLRDGRPSEPNAMDYLEDKNVSEEYIAHLEKFSNFTLSLGLEEISAFHLGHVTRSFLKYWKPGLIIGGCGSVINKLKKLILQSGIDIYTGITVKKINLEAGAIFCVSVSPSFDDAYGIKEGESIELKSNNIISDLGPKITTRLLSNDVKKNSENNDFLSGVEKIREASGFKFHVNVKKPPLKDAGVVFPLQSSRIGGFSIVSNGDKSLAPEKSHLLIGHAVMRSNNSRKEIDEGIKDLELILGDSFEFEDILSIGIFKDSWPVNRARQGYDIGCSTPIDGLYLVGDGCKPLGLPMAEGVASSVKVVLKNAKLFN